MPNPYESDEIEIEDTRSKQSRHFDRHREPFNTYRRGMSDHDQTESVITIDRNAHAA